MPDTLPETVRRLMADVFELDPSAVSDNAEIGIPEQWDSGNHIRLVLALEEEFGVSFEVSDIESMVSFRAVVTTLESKL